MHKILRIVYGMLKHRKKFDPSIDEANRNKTKEKEKEKNNDKNKDKVKQKLDKNRRYQSHDQNAPISRRQNQKRKKLQKDTIKEENVVIRKGVKAKEKSFSKEPTG